MKKQVITLVLLVCLLTGCSSSSKALLPYSEGTIKLNTTISDESAQVADLFAKDLCLIPKDYSETKDASITSEASLIVDASTNEVLYADNVYERIYPASITKIATTLVALKHAKLTDTVTVSKNAANVTTPGAKLCGLKEGDTIQLEVLLNSFMVYSGNDAGVAIAEHVAGSVEDFSAMMNEETKKLGAVHSNFVNPHGLHDDNHYTTAYDIYLIFQALIKDERFVTIINQSSYTAKYKDKTGKDITAVFPSTNRYLKGTETPPEGISVFGGKTGTTDKAGSCLVLYSKDSKGDDYISLVLKAANGDDLFSQMTQLLSKISS